MKKEGHTQAFSYLVLKQASDYPEADTWITVNKAKVIALFNWANDYALPVN